MKGIKMNWYSKFVIGFLIFPVGLIVVLLASCSSIYWALVLIVPGFLIICIAMGLIIADLTMKDVGDKSSAMKVKNNR